MKIEREEMRVKFARFTHVLERDPQLDVEALAERFGLTTKEVYRWREKVRYRQKRGKKRR